MAKQSVSVELDEETFACLAALGEPTEVLAQLACSVAHSVRGPVRELRKQTEKSLRFERDKTDVALAEERENVQRAAIEVVRIARQRADQVMRSARDTADREGGPQSRVNETRQRRQTDSSLAEARSKADALVERERADGLRHQDKFLARERKVTDGDLVGERARLDRLIVEQREANTQMVAETIRAQEIMIEAEAALGRAEEGERELRTVAEFREMFIGILGHDLRNPVSSIAMGAGLLIQGGALDERDRKIAARIIRGSQRISRMVTQLLDLTRARLGGGLPVERAPTDLREICQNTVEEFEATIRLEVEGDVTGTWDADRLAELLSNLARNAIEHAAPETEVLLKAHAEGADVVVEVTNQGDPIPGDVLPFIFEPFRRAQQQQKSATGNLGLGLYIAKQIVLSHGGTLDAHSADGMTTFAMRLPQQPEKLVESP